MTVVNAASPLAAALRVGLVACIAAAGLAVSAAAAQDVFVDDGRLHLLTGADYGDVLERGDILVRDGRIVAVGPELTPPPGVPVIDAAGKEVTPGLFAAWSQIGLLEIGLDAEANDASPKGDFPMSAALDARDAFNPDSTLIPVNRAGGVTRALSAPTSGDLMFGGRAAVVDMTGSPGSVTKAPAAQSVALGYAGARRAGDTRMGAWAELRAYLDEARRYAANPRLYANRPAAERFDPRDVAALAPVVAGDEPLILSANRAADLRLAIDLKAAYGLDLIVLGATEGWRVADALAAAGIPVIVDPMANLPYGFEDIASTLANAARLHAAGVDVAFISDGTHNLRNLPQYAGNAVANGMPYGAALAAISAAPAAFYGLDGDLGTLEAGKLGDLVIWDGDPLEVTSRPEAVFIAGIRQSLDTRPDALRERYRDLSRGDLPLAYGSVR